MQTVLLLTRSVYKLDRPTRGTNHSPCEDKSFPLARKIRKSDPTLKPLFIPLSQSLMGGEIALTNYFLGCKTSIAFAINIPSSKV